MSDQLSERTIDLLGLADTKRWTVIKTLRNQSVAEHSFNVAIIAWELASRLEVSPQLLRQVLIWALIHDAPETYTGDVDGRAKRDFPILKNSLTIVEHAKFEWYSNESPAPVVRVIVKVADTIEAITFIRTWGRGLRAEDVVQELTKKLYGTDVPGLMTVAGYSDWFVVASVKAIMEQSTNEINSVQFRERSVATET